MNQAGVLEGNRGVIRRERQQHPVDGTRKVTARTRRDDQTALAIDTDRNGNAVARLRAVADIENDLMARA